MHRAAIVMVTRVEFLRRSNAGLRKSALSFRYLRELATLKRIEPTQWNTSTMDNTDELDNGATGTICLMAFVYREDPRQRFLRCTSVDLPLLIMLLSFPIFLTRIKVGEGIFMLCLNKDVFRFGVGQQHVLCYTVVGNSMLAPTSHGNGMYTPLEKQVRCLVFICVASSQVC